MRRTKVGSCVKIFPSIQHSLKELNKKCWVQTVQNSSSAIELGKKSYCCLRRKRWRWPSSPSVLRLEIVLLNVCQRIYVWKSGRDAEIPAVTKNVETDSQEMLVSSSGNLDWKHLKGWLKRSMKCGDDVKGEVTCLSHALFFCEFWAFGS